MSTLSVFQRRQLPNTDYADPSRHLLWIVDNADVEYAAHIVATTDQPPEVRSRIVEIAKRKGLTIPESLKNG